MSPVLKLYLRVFLVLSAIQLVCIVLISYWTNGEARLLGDFIQSVCVAGSATVFAAILQVRTLRAVQPGPITEEMLLVEQSALVPSHLSLIEVEQRLIRDTCTQGYKFSLIKSGLQIKTPVTWHSWGEVITIEPATLDGDRPGYSIKSRSGDSWRLVDLGSSFRAVRLLEDVIQGRDAASSTATLPA